MINTGIIASVATRITGSNLWLTRPDSDCSHIISSLIRLGGPQPCIGSRPADAGDMPLA